jgi:hypothetical protein
MALPSFMRQAGGVAMRRPAMGGGRVSRLKRVEL